MVSSLTNIVNYKLGFFRCIVHLTQANFCQPKYEDCILGLRMFSHKPKIVILKPRIVIDIPRIMNYISWFIV